MLETIDTASVAPFAQGRFIFRFKWAEYDRCAFRFTTKQFGRKYKITGELRHSLAGEFRSKWDNNELDSESPFIRYFFANEPGAMHAWQHICRIHEMGGSING